MVETVLIRPMTRGDVAECLRIERATYPTPWTEGIFTDELTAVGRVYLVAEAEGVVAGYAGLLLVIPEAHVTSVTVDPVFRGRGLGTRLMLRLMDEALASGARSLTLEVRLSNLAAQALYHRFGMAPVGVRKKYYQDEDALVMWVHDIDGPEYRARLDEIRRGLA
ncbi:MAG TPA: ribosomal protein S18-alanine N-acetyltransferase [Acidimicrobiia bacterium]|jgi:ribosomal-protein-alanine N-acetyltransferase|nr:ribosomal protein S18-alanine N-acetyltransferase [Acidimicrobiia bacterium]